MTHRHPVRVYYEDTDLAGLVYHANHLRFLERGRTEALRAAGVEQGRLRAGTGVVFVARRIEIDYRAAARFDDLLEVLTRLESRTGARAVLRQELRRAEPAAVIAEARVVLACVDAEGRAVRLPIAVRDALDRLGAEQ